MLSSTEIPSEDNFEAELCGSDDRNFLYIRIYSERQVDLYSTVQYYLKEHNKGFFKKPIPVDEIKERMFVTVQENEHDFYRAEVLHIDDCGRIHCFKIDEGTFCINLPQTVFRIGECDLKAPPLTMKCRLEGLELFDGLPNLDCVYRFIKMAELPEDPYYIASIVNIKDGIPLVRMSLNGVGLTDTVQNWITTICRISFAKSSSTETKAEVVHADDKGYVWLHTEHDYELLQRIEEKLESTDLESYDSKMPKPTINNCNGWKKKYCNVPTAVYITKSQDGVYYRAKLTRPLNKEKSEVEFIDYGNKEIVSRMSLILAMNVDENLAFIPPQCCKAKLEGVKSLNLVEFWNAVPDLVNVVFRDRDEEVIGVEIFEPGSTVSINSMFKTQSEDTSLGDSSKTSDEPAKDCNKELPDVQQEQFSNGNKHTSATLTDGDSDLKNIEDNFKDLMLNDLGKEEPESRPEEITNQLTDAFLKGNQDLGTLSSGEVEFMDEDKEDPTPDFSNTSTEKCIKSEEANDLYAVESNIEESSNQKFGNNSMSDHELNTLTSEKAESMDEDKKDSEQDSFDSSEPKGTESGDSNLDSELNTQSSKKSESMEEDRKDSGLESLNSSSEESNLDSKREYDYLVMTRQAKLSQLIDTFCKDVEAELNQIENLKECQDRLQKLKLGLQQAALMDIEHKSEETDCTIEPKLFQETTTEESGIGSDTSEDMTEPLDLRINFRKSYDDLRFYNYGDGDWDFCDPLDSPKVVPEIPANTTWNFVVTEQHINGYFSLQSLENGTELRKLEQSMNQYYSKASSNECPALHAFDLKTNGCYAMFSKLKKRWIRVKLLRLPEEELLICLPICMIDYGKYAKIEAREWMNVRPLKKMFAKLPMQGFTGSVAGAENVIPYLMAKAIMSNSADTLEDLHRGLCYEDKAVKCHIFSYSKDSATFPHLKLIFLKYI